MPLLASRIAVLVTGLAAFGGVAYAVTLAAREDDAGEFEDPQVWLPLLTITLFGLVVLAHLRQRHVARATTRLRWSRAADVSVVVGIAVVVGLAVMLIGNGRDDDPGEVLAGCGLVLWLETLLAPMIGAVLWLSFVSAPLRVGREITPRAGWYLLGVMVGVYGLSVSLSLGEYDVPWLFSGRATPLWLGITAIGVVLIVEQLRATRR